MSNEIGDLIRTAGLRATTPRSRLLEYLKGHPHASMQDLIRALASIMNEVTVYRTIDSFMKAGLVKTVELGKGRTQYEMREGGHGHHHLVCTSCDTVSTFDRCDINTLARIALRQTKSFATITDHSIDLFGICKACAR